MKFILLWVAILFALTVLVPICMNVSTDIKINNTQNENTGDSIRVYFKDKSEVKTMNTEDYILGVVMAEMPAEFEVEALKAQSVAARTYLYEKLYYNGDDPLHHGGDICTDSTHCQAYISVSQAKKKWGKNASSYLKKCKKAVSETNGIIAEYNDKPIKAVFHAISSGKTENANDVWGSDVAYLKSVDSPGDVDAPNFISTKIIDAEEFKKEMSAKYNCDFSRPLYENINRSDSGYVESLVVGGVTVKGKDIRQIFGLRSANFEISQSEGNLTFNVKGYGHGVGMSQYGANYFAKEGLNFEEILKKYYSDINLVSVH